MPMTDYYQWLVDFLFQISIIDYTQMYISLDSSDFAILQKTKITTCDIPGCVAGAQKIQTISDNISLKFI